MLLERGNPMTKPTILIVDDEPQLLRSLSLLFKRDFNVLTASNGREACEIFNSTPSLSLILLDLDMPIMTGIEALDIIRATNSNVKVIIMTGRSSHEYAKKCANLNVQGYIEKPFEMKQLREQIQSALGLEDFKILRELWNNDYEKRLDSISDFIKKTIHYLEKQDYVKLSIKELAKQLEVTHEHLSRIFHKECGIRLNEYMRKIKIEKGKEYLVKNHQLSIKDIAASIGINDDKHFCKIFKEETGVTPTEFRKRTMKC